MYKSDKIYTKSYQTTITWSQEKVVITQTESQSLCLSSCHYLHHSRTVEGDVTPLCRCSDGVHHLHDSVQSRVGTDGHVSATEVIVDGTHHPDDVQVGRFLGIIFSDFTYRTKQTQTLRSHSFIFMCILGFFSPVKGNLGKCLPSISLLL